LPVSAIAGRESLWESRRRSCSVADWVYANAQIAPDGLAFADETQTALSWLDLHRRLARIRLGLRERGIGPSDPVAVAIQTSVETAVTLFGVMSAAVATPQNPSLTVAEAVDALAATGARAVITTAGSNAAAAAGRLGVPVYDPGSIAAGGEEIAGSAPREGEVKLVLPTSGTTGTRKLVPLTDRNLAAGAKLTAATLRLDPDDRCLNVMPLFHTHGIVGAVLASIFARAAVICPSSLGDAAIVGATRTWRPTWTTAAPAVHHVVLNVAHAIPDLFRLRFLRATSAPLPLALHEELEATYRAPVVQAYALTEAPGQITSNPLPPGERKPATVGRAVGCEVRVVDPDGAVTSAIGEIMVRGPQVMPGYLRVEDPGSEFVDGWLRTGDLGHIDDYGYLTIVGRLKEIVNRGGEKVAPAEVDDALHLHDSVRDAATFGVEHRTLGEDIWAAVALEAGARVSPAELASFLRERLAPYKIPTRIFFVESIPRTSSGKVRRAALSERYSPGPGARR
jgi:acyl-CoA synthetase (AMP-forming)/AMP-acid ligase II